MVSRPTHPNNQLPYDPASVYLLETMISLTIKTRQYIEETWPIVFGHISNILSSAARFSDLLIERAVVGLLRLCLIIADVGSLRGELYLALDLLGGLPPPVLHAVAEELMDGVSAIIKNHLPIIRSQTEWALTFTLLRATVAHHEATRLTFDTVQDILSRGEGVITSDNIFGLITILDDYATLAGEAVNRARLRDQRRSPPSPTASEPVLARGQKAIDLLAEIKKSIPTIINNSNLPPAEAWRTFWMPLLSCLAQHSSNSSREVRHQALTHLQRVLLGPQISAVPTPAITVTSSDEPEPEPTSPTSSHVDAHNLFGQIIFPLMNDLLQPAAFARDPQSIPETRLRASMMLCKTFLHFNAHQTEKFTELKEMWLGLLEFLEHFMHSGRRHDQLYESIPESLKNVILVMNASGLVVPPRGEPDTRTEEQKDLWDVTYKTVEHFLPGFTKAVFPPPPPPMAAVPPRASQQQIQELVVPVTGAAAAPPPSPKPTS
jgi:brefeldin A-resistance guanine nucleotide exchange factor 1